MVTDISYNCYFTDDEYIEDLFNAYLKAKKGIK